MCIPEFTNLTPMSVFVHQKHWFFLSCMCRAVYSFSIIQSISVGAKGLKQTDYPNELLLFENQSFCVTLGKALACWIRLQLLLKIQSFVPKTQRLRVVEALLPHISFHHHIFWRTTAEIQFSKLIHKNCSLLCFWRTDSNTHRET